MTVAYPSFPVLLESSDTMVGAAMLDRGTNGGLRGRSFSDLKHECTLVHQLATDEWDELVAVFTSAQNDNVSFTWPGGTPRYYRFKKYPDRKPLDGGEYQVTCMLMEE